MEDIRFNKICVSVFGDLGALPSLIERVSEKDVRVLHNHKGSTLFVFDSAANVDEIKDYLNTGDNSFFIFDMITGGDIVIGSDTSLKDQKSEKARIKTDGEVEIDTSNLCHEDKAKRIDELLDKGIDNLNMFESTLLNKLSKEI